METTIGIETGITMDTTTPHTVCVALVQFHGLRDDATIDYGKNLPQPSMHVTRAGRCVLVSGVAFIEWSASLVGVTVTNVQEAAWRSLLDFDALTAQSGAGGVVEMVGLDCFAVWADGRQQRVELSVDDLWTELVRLAGEEV